jgi:transposase
VFQMERTVRKYPKEFKQESVNLALKSPSISKTATELGIPVATLHSWIHQFKSKAKPKLAKGKPTNNSQNVAALIEENRRLHKELAVTREEREILKKAAAYFGQHQK